ncbi:bifunctional 4-hydroxy-3-methylbut-2-enyl diphosphate reductase/30S ribosomal protein S1 [Ammonifex thiophilus]|uniref:4-hydroxy-3-methylbut-2-enyl diphosphate reductase n=1 Tax=Ammonifex thiophilus TaxID=444093 RepID=A0A3D8P2Z5_9THEO|nr:bifunctional 4-hydroxy-3-methylbut-2-enyl diphosphate reductase/30S ribosomal protein S1 [Ammonifex thiophilus]RDV80939.1 bifunctional 4-hydroxy-3-methylbut-2-enyl diphosphate reductase/30S ribosomal protein S1 [Ammonifex thiophilus]
MEVKRARNAGFCFGVRRALEITLKAREEKEGPLYTLGPLIHNPQVVEFLASKGVKLAESLEEITEGTVIIRSHGVDPAVIREAEARGLTVIDATCPYVRRAQELACELAKQGYQVVVVGDRDHPEVKGILGWAGPQAVVVGSAEEVAGLPEAPAYGVVAQTTQPINRLQEVVHALLPRAKEVRVYNTICSAVASRIESALELAREVEVMVVVGGRSSANTRHLVERLQLSGVPTYHVETAAELRPEWFMGVSRAGLTAGASTPDWIIEEVEKRMREIGEMSAAEQMEAVGVKTFRGGEIVRGTVVEINQGEVLVDIGAKTEGVIPLRELCCCEVSSPHEVVKVGDEIEVFVVKAEDAEGRIILSKARADAIAAWKKLAEAFANGTPVEGVVREVVKGGLIVDVGVRAFLPASLVDTNYVENLSAYLGQKVRAKVIELDRSRKKVVLSRKAVLEEEAERRRRETWEKLQEGAVVKGVVRRIVPFGAFIDLGGVDGLLHVSEIAWHRVNSPDEVLQEGQEIEVKVIKVDRENEKVSLSRKALLPDPWEKVPEKYPVGSLVEVKVVRLAPFGAFVELEPGVEGLIHISHFADWHVEKPEDVLKEGDVVTARVISFDPQEKRLRLSLREAVRTEEPQPKEKKEDTVTLGDVFGDLLKS